MIEGDDDMTNSVRVGHGATQAGRLVGVALVMLTLMVEGFDLQAANLVGPSIVADFGISRSQLGPLLSASLVGILLGSTRVAPLGDRYGRKPVLIVASLAYGLLSLGAASATSITQLAVLRFLIGIGLGAVMPNGLTLAGEMFEEHRQASMTGLVGIGITMGGVLAGVTSAEILPHWHWRGVFVVGGVLPVAIALLLALCLREPPLAADDVRHKRGSVRAILVPSLRASTLTVWVVFASMSLAFHLLSSWIPLMVARVGQSPASAAWTTTAFHAGGVSGGIVASLLLTRGHWQTAALFMSGACVTMLLLGAFPAGPSVSLALFIVAGFFVAGTLNAINGAAGGLYPMASRATGLGWSLGIARVGSIMGPLVGSVAATAGIDRDHRFFFLPVLPLAIALVASLALARGRPSPKASQGGRA